jgi:hypothetical protein
MAYTAEQKFFQKLLKVYLCLLKGAGYCLDNQKGEIKLMANYVVKDDNPDVGFELTLGDVTDAEDNVISDPQGLTTEILSTHEGVVKFTGTSDKAGTVSFGAPGQANLNYNVKDANGKVLASGSDGFTVTTGDPAAVSSITAKFEGLNPVDEVPPAPETTATETAPAEAPAPAEGSSEAPATGSTESTGPADGGSFE